MGVMVVVVVIGGAAAVVLMGLQVSVFWMGLLSTSNPLLEVLLESSPRITFFGEGLTISLSLLAIPKQKGRGGYFS